jgi:ribosome maturation factor RimP
MADKMQALSDMLSPVVEAAGVSLYEIELVREGGERILRLYIDKPDGGIDLADCERVSHAAEAILDANDPIPHAYALEVSSPGIERKLSRPAHYTRYVGQDIRLRLYAPVENRRNFRGKLTSYENEIITLEITPDEQLQLPLSAVASCRLAVFED